MGGNTNKDNMRDLSKMVDHVQRRIKIGYGVNLVLVKLKLNIWNVNLVKESKEVKD